MKPARLLAGALPAYALVAPVSASSAVGRLALDVDCVERAGILRAISRRPLARSVQRTALDTVPPELERLGKGADNGDATAQTELTDTSPVEVWCRTTGPPCRGTAARPSRRRQSVEATLGLDRPPRRLIHQALAAEGFDRGVPDGLFGPRTRAAIRAWQAAWGRGRDGVSRRNASRVADGNRCAANRGGGRAAGHLGRDRGRPGPGCWPTGPSGLRCHDGSFAPVPDESTGPALAAVVREGWNSRICVFFRDTTVEEVTASLAAGADVAARNDYGDTSLSFPVWMAIAAQLPRPSTGTFQIRFVHRRDRRWRPITAQPTMT